MNSFRRLILRLATIEIPVLFLHNWFRYCCSFFIVLLEPKAHNKNSNLNIQTSNVWIRKNARKCRLFSRLQTAYMVDTIVRCQPLSAFLCALHFGISPDVNLLSATKIEANQRTPYISEHFEFNWHTNKNYGHRQMVRSPFVLAISVI